MFLPPTYFAPDLFGFAELQIADNPECELCGNHSLQVVCQCGHVYCANCQKNLTTCMTCGGYVEMMLVDRIDELLDKQLTFKLSECTIVTTLRTF